jgi:integrase
MLPSNICRAQTRFRSTNQAHDRAPLAAEKQIRRQTFPLCSATHRNCLICGVGEEAGAIALSQSAVIGPCDRNPLGYQQTFKNVWKTTLRRAGIPYFRLYDLRSTYATRLSAGDVADESVTQLLRKGAPRFEQYAQMKLQMKREALQKMNRQANDSWEGF